MKKLSVYLLLLSLLVISVSACSSTEDPASTPAETYLTIQLRADAGAGNVTLDWQMLQSATTYNIYYIADTGGAYNADNRPSSATMKAGTPITGIISATRTISGLTNGTTYWFAISAVNTSGESDLSRAIPATPAVTPPPAAPENVRANAGIASVKVTWSTVAGADHYKIYCWFLDGTSTAINTGTGTPIIAYGNSNTVTSITWLSGSDDNVNISGQTLPLNNGRTYHFYVTAVNSGAVEGSSSFDVSATPSATPPPEAPTITNVTAGSSSITVYWDPVGATPAVTQYNIYIARAKGVTKSTGEVSEIIPPPNQGTATSLTNGTTYYIVVTAVNANGESAESREWWAKPLSSGTGTAGEVE